MYLYGNCISKPKKKRKRFYIDLSLCFQNQKLEFLESENLWGFFQTIYCFTYVLRTMRIPLESISAM